jgi:GTP cyclohydrolase II
MAIPAPRMLSDVEFVAETQLPTERGLYRVRAYRDRYDGSEPLAIVQGDVAGMADVPVRVHDECLTSEVLGSLKCDCREQLDFALGYIRDHAPGVVIYLRQEGRGIGLANKIAAYALQEQGHDTVDANRLLGLPDDARRYEGAAAILRDLGVQSIRLMTNNPRKVARLESLGVQITDRIPVLMATNPHNVGYLEAKQARMGHVLASAPIRVLRFDPTFD